MVGLKTLCLFFIQSEVKCKTNNDSLPCIYLRFASATYNYLEFWLVQWNGSVLYDWLVTVSVNTFGFGFTTLNWNLLQMTMYTKIRVPHCNIPAVDLGALLNWLWGMEPILELKIWNVVLQEVARLKHLSGKSAKSGECRCKAEKIMNGRVSP